MSFFSGFSAQKSAALARVEPTLSLLKTEKSSIRALAKKTGTVALEDYQIYLKADWGPRSDGQQLFAMRQCKDDALRFALDSLYVAEAESDASIQAVSVKRGTTTVTVVRVNNSMCYYMFCCYGADGYSKGSVEENRCETDSRDVVESYFELFLR